MFIRSTHFRYICKSVVEGRYETVSAPLPPQSILSISNHPATLKVIKSNTTTVASVAYSPLIHSNTSPSIHLEWYIDKDEAYNPTSFRSDASPHYRGGHLFNKAIRGSCCLILSFWTERVVEGAIQIQPVESQQQGRHRLYYVVIYEY